jgi:hypothetical protein
MQENSYKEAIQGYDFHINRFNAWMNLYAIFVGAFFVAYCTMYGKSSFLDFTIIIAGYITSLCWLGSFIGY